MKGGKRILPYVSATFVSSKQGIFHSRFGIGNSYNGRVETLKEKWGEMDRGFIEAEAFFEGIGLFEDSLSYDMKLACLYNMEGFIIITRSSKGTIIEPYHSRCPVILESAVEFLNSGRIIEIDYKRLKIAG